jgi:hypothetical protein
VLAAVGAQAQERPKYDELLQAVSHADCERSEAEDFVRFICRESRAVWYFTKEGMEAHPAYLVWPAWGPSERMPITNGMFGRGSAPRGTTREAARVKAEAFGEWNREIFDVWRRTQPRLEEDRLQTEQERKERLERRLWPAE